MNILRSNRNFRFFMSSNALSAIGGVLFNLVFIVYAQNMENAKLAISAIVIVSTIPMIGDFLLGYFSDRTVHKYRMFLMNKLVQMLIYLVFAFLMSFEANWIIFGCLLLLNFVSDLISSYNVYLEILIVKHLVKSESLTDARALDNGLHHTVGLVGKLFGASLIVLLNYNFSWLSLLNALLFLLSFYILWCNRQQFKIVIPSKNHYEGERLNVKTIVQDSYKNFKTLFKYKQIFHFAMIFALMNLISSAQEGLLLLSYSENEALLFFNFTFTLTLYTTAEALGMITGSMFPFKALRKTSIEANLIFEIVLTVLIIFNLLLIEERYSLLILLFLSGYFMGISNPRIDAFIMQTLPDKVLSSVTSIFYTLVQLTIPVGTFVFLTLSNIFSIKLAWLMLSVVGVGLLIYAFMLARQYHTQPEKHSEG
ncbi:TPA: MFS transporter [Staphylococcus pseudintermedius]|nr:MFS transporter [Staphylococcus pseudintermedius]